MHQYQNKVHEPSSAFPSIRLIAATPSASGISASGSLPSHSSPNSSLILPLPQAPTQLLQSPAKANIKGKLVPKKSKLALRALGLGGPSTSANVNNASVGRERGRDLSDVVRRVGASASVSSSGREIWVERTEEDVSIAVEETASLVILKKGKKKERAALGDLGWGANGVGGGDRNLEKENTKEKERDKESGRGTKDKWWTLALGRGKNLKENANPERAKCQ